MSRKKKTGAAAGQSTPATSAAIGAATEPDEESVDVVADDEEAMDTEGPLLPEGDVVPVEPCATCGRVEACEHLREGAALPPDAPPRVAIEGELGATVTLEAAAPPLPTFGEAFAAHTAAFSREVDQALRAAWAPSSSTLGALCYGDLAAVMAEVGETSPGPIPPFSELPPRVQHAWEAFGARVQARIANASASAPAPAPPADAKPVPRGFVRCRARTSLALPPGALNEAGRAITTVRGGAVCVVAERFFERERKHLEKL